MAEEENTDINGDEADRDLAEVKRNAKRLRQSISDFHAHWELYVENQRMLSKLMGCRLAYLMECGFERQEAIHIIVARGIS